MIAGRRHRRGGRPAHPRRGPPRHPRAERRRNAADGPVGSAELGGFHRGLGDRREGRALLDPGGAQSAARAGSPRPGGLERRGRERIAALGRLRRRQAHALADGQIRQWGRQAEGARHPLPGDRAAADHRRDRGRRRRLQRLRQGGGSRPRGVPGPVRRAAAAPQFGDHLVAVLDDPQYATGVAFGLKGDTGITVLEGEAA